MWRPLARVRWELPRSEGREHSAERVVDVDGWCRSTRARARTGTQAYASGARCRWARLVAEVLLAQADRLLVRDILGARLVIDLERLRLVEAATTPTNEQHRQYRGTLECEPCSCVAPPRPRR